MGECGLSLSKCVCIMQLCFFSFRIFLSPVNFDGLSNISISFFFFNQFLLLLLSISFYLFLSHYYYYYYLSHLLLFFYFYITLGIKWNLRCLNSKDYFSKNY